METFHIFHPSFITHKKVLKKLTTILNCYDNNTTNKLPSHTSKNNNKEICRKKTNNTPTHTQKSPQKQELHIYIYIPSLYIHIHVPTSIHVNTCTHFIKCTDNISPASPSGGPANLSIQNSQTFQTLFSLCLSVCLSVSLSPLFKNQTERMFNLNSHVVHAHPFLHSLDVKLLPLHKLHITTNSQSMKLFC